VLANGSYQERKLTLARRSGGQVLIASGLKQGEKVALKDPTLPENKEQK
jgi:multidrug efflux pump subunit AcrA (membrane-fusion protein)